MCESNECPIDIAKFTLHMQYLKVVTLVYLETIFSTSKCDNMLLYKGQNTWFSVIILYQATIIIILNKVKFAYMCLY